MEVELLEVRDFLAQHAPFDALSDDALAGLANAVTIRYLRRASRLDRSRTSTELTVVRQGAIEVRTANGDVRARVGEGELLGYRAFPVPGTDDDLEHEALEDSLLYQIERKIVDRLCDTNERCRSWLRPAGAERLHAARSAAGRADHDARMVTRLADVLARAPVAIEPDASIRDAATLMSREHVSSLLVTEGARLVGILTDRDLRLKVIAAGRPTDGRVGDIMTEAPVTLPPDAFVYEALLLMSRLRIHHLPVCHADGDIAGMVTSSDFIERHTASGIELAADIHRRTDAAGLAAVAERLPELLRQLGERDAPIERIGPVMSGMADAVLQRLIVVSGGDNLPDSGWCWLTGGATGRQEALGAHRQVSALLVDARLGETEETALGELAKSVCRGLETCGYRPDERSLCADRNPGWLTVGNLAARAESLLASDEDAAVETVSAWLDCRAVAGEMALWEPCRRELHARIVAAPELLERFRRQAARQLPPVGFFRERLLKRRSTADAADEGSGEMEGSIVMVDRLDLATDLLEPIVDLGRFMALACDSTARSTRDRLAAVARAGTMQPATIEALVAALDYAKSVHIAWMSRRSDSSDGGGPSESIATVALTRDERAFLTDAFVAIRHAREEVFANGTTGRSDSTSRAARVVDASAA